MLGRVHHPEPLIAIRDNGPTHGGEAPCTYLATPDLDLRLVRPPAYRPDFNAAGTSQGHHIRLCDTVRTLRSARAGLSVTYGLPLHFPLARPWG